MTMVETVAAAIWAKKEALTPPPRVSWENATPEDRTFVSAIARAAIEAMREPEDTMTRAGSRAAAERKTWAGRTRTAVEEDVDFLHGYRAAIDAALSEGDGTR